MENKKSYYAIIPANVRYDERLTPNANYCMVRSQHYVMTKDIVGLITNIFLNFIMFLKILSQIGLNA